MWDEMTNKEVFLSRTDSGSHSHNVLGVDVDSFRLLGLISGINRDGCDYASGSRRRPSE